MGHIASLDEVAGLSTSVFTLIIETNVFHRLVMLSLKEEMIFKNTRLFRIET